MIRVRARDDRGNEVRLVRFGPGRAGAWSGAVRLMRSPLGPAIVAAAGFAALAAAVGWFVGGDAIGLVVFSPVIATTMASVLGVVGSVGGLWQSRGERLRREMIRVGRCASCGYPLDGVEQAGDGCRVCPECGAAWNPADERYGEPRTIVIARGTVGP